MRTRTHTFLHRVGLFALLMTAVGAFSVVCPMDASASVLPVHTAAAAVAAEAPAVLEVDVPDTPANPAGALVHSLLALAAGLIGFGVVKGNQGGYIVDRKEVRAGSHVGPDITGRLAADGGKQTAGEILGWDSHAHDAELRPALLAGEQIGTGDGTDKTFSGSFDSALEPRTVTITAGTAVLQDDGAGTLYGDGTGTVNYATGAVAVEFAAAPANAVAITGRALREIAGPLLRDADPAYDGVVAVASHGTVALAALTAGGAELPTWIRRALIRRGIVAG